MSQKQQKLGTGGQRMDREILFRGKRIDNGEWVEGCLLYGGEGRAFIVKKDGAYGECDYCGECACVYPDSIQYEVIPETRGQYTGLKDKNGKKIFEGDIVSFIDYTSTESGYSEQQCVGEVMWINEEACFSVTNRLAAESYEVIAECAIIGNIHDNPELLEED